MVPIRKGFEKRLSDRHTREDKPVGVNSPFCPKLVTRPNVVPATCHMNSNLFDGPDWSPQIVLASSCLLLVGQDQMKI